MAAPIVTCPNCGRKNRLASSPEGVPRCAVCHELLPWMVEAEPASFDEELKASVPVLVDFWAPWCGPCRWVSPAVEAMARKKAGRLKVVKLNIDNAPALAERYEIRGIPALVLFRDGREAARLAGAVPQPQLEEWLEQQLRAPAPAGA
jgi:thioredoxin 2